MIPAQPQAKSGPKPKSEFEAFEVLASKLLNVPKSALSTTRKNATVKRPVPAKKKRLSFSALG